MSLMALGQQRKHIMGIQHLSQTVQTEAAKRGMNEGAVLKSLLAFFTKHGLTEDLVEHLNEEAEGCEIIDEDSDLQDILDATGWDDGTVIKHVATLLEWMHLEDDFAAYFLG